MQLFKDIPETKNMLHGDYHIKNIMRQGNENLLIDMDTLSVGHPIFELAQMYFAYQGFSETNHEEIKRFLGIDRDTGLKFWNCSLKYYFEDKDEAFISDITDKARIICYTRILRRTLRREPDKTEMIENCTNHLCELVPVTDKLYF